MGVLLLLLQLFLFFERVLLRDHRLDFLDEESTKYISKSCRLSKIELFVGNRARVLSM